MLPLSRTRLFAVTAIVVVGIFAVGCFALLAAPFSDNVSLGDPDPEANNTVAVCSDVPVHVSYTVNIGTEAKPDNRKLDDDLEASGHDLDPFDDNARRRCVQVGSAFGSRVDFKAPGLNDGQPFSVTAPPDRERFLVVRFTKNADDTITGTQKSVVVPSSYVP